MDTRGVDVVHGSLLGLLSDTFSLQYTAPVLLSWFCHSEPRQLAFICILPWICQSHVWAAISFWLCMCMIWWIPNVSLGTEHIAEPNHHFSTSTTTWLSSVKVFTPNTKDFFILEMEMFWMCSQILLSSINIKTFSFQY